MTKDDEKYYENFFDLFNAPGWKQFVGEIEAAFGSYRIEALNTEQELYFAKGERAILHRILSFQNQVELAYKEANNTDSEVEDN